MRFDLLASEEGNLWVINAQLKRNVKSLEVGLALFYAGLPTFLVLRDPDKDIPSCRIEIPPELQSVVNSGNTLDSTFRITEIFL